MRNRFEGEDGANAVEFALVLPLLVMLIFGAITAGLALNARQQLDHAAREGSRFAATLETGASACGSPTRTWYECVRDHVLATSVGSVSLTTGGICITYVTENGASDDYASEYFGTITAADGTTDADAPCVAESTPLEGDRVHVKVREPSRVNAVFVRTPLFDLTASSISRYEEA